MKPAICYAIRYDPSGMAPFDVMAVTSERSRRLFGRDGSDNPTNTTWSSVIYKNGDRARVEALCTRLNAIRESFNHEIQENRRALNEIYQRRGQAINTAIAEQEVPS